jgi:hypothetical protein
MYIYNIIQNMYTYIYIEPYVISLLYPWNPVVIGVIDHHVWWETNAFLPSRNYDLNMGRVGAFCVKLDVESFK